MKLDRSLPASLVPFFSSLVLVAAFLGFAYAKGGIPFFTVRPLSLGIRVEPFGTIVVAGVFLGALLLRRYAARHGIDPDEARNLTLWIVLTGAIGAHVFELLMYERPRMDADPLLILKLWDGISSYGGFIGGGIGYALYVRRKRLPAGLVADTVVIGLLVAFSIGRIGCTIIHDHVGSATGFWMGTDYPRSELASRHLLSAFPGAGASVRAHNLGLYELLFLVPLNALVLTLAFRDERPLPAGCLAILVALVYAPARFLLEYLRLDVSDPRYAGLTFAQWCSLIAFAMAAATAVVVLRHGKPAPTMPANVAGQPDTEGGRRSRRPRSKSVSAA
jgi:phosphatidylglycerol:prolipoprotein diacylglycerol transferase